MIPIIPVVDWQTIYLEFLKQVLSNVPLQRITFGGICIYQSARRLMEIKLGEANAISSALDQQRGSGADGRIRFRLDQRIHIYRHLMGIVQELRPDLPIALCLEERTAFEALGLTSAMGRCNCVL